MDNSSPQNLKIVSRAFKAYSSKDYQEAIDLYTQASELISTSAFKLNIELCKKKAKLDSTAIYHLKAFLKLEKEITQEKPIRVRCDICNKRLELQVAYKIAEKEIQTKVNNKELVIAIRYFRKDMSEINYNEYKLNISEKFGPFIYATAKKSSTIRLQPPSCSDFAELSFYKWTPSSKEIILHSITNKQSQSITDKIGSQSQKKYAPRTIAINELKVASILDEFSLISFSSEVCLLSLTPDNWLAQISEEKPDFLFVESCWRGNYNTWCGLIYNYNSSGTNQMEELEALIEYCNKNDIPTIFWNKEDPVHFDKFADTACLFDVILTSDENCIERYKKGYGREATAMSFYCSPKLHHPLNKPQTRKAIFAGSYYSEKKERCEDFGRIINAIKESSIEFDIYDRCESRSAEHLKYPIDLRSNIVGHLDYEELAQINKTYWLTMNLNTVKHSNTMFARRVYESLGSGIPVISNYSQGVNTLFGGICCASDCPTNLKDYINALKDEVFYAQIRQKGINQAMIYHTFRHRISFICQKINIKTTELPMKVRMNFRLENSREINRAISLYSSQEYSNKECRIILSDDELIHRYLNASTDTISFSTNYARQGIDTETLDLECSNKIEYHQYYLHNELAKSRYLHYQDELAN